MIAAKKDELIPGSVSQLVSQIPSDEVGLTFHIWTLPDLASTGSEKIPISYLFILPGTFSSFSITTLLTFWELPVIYLEQVGPNKWHKMNLLWATTTCFASRNFLFKFMFKSFNELFKDLKI